MRLSSSDIDLTRVKLCFGKRTKTVGITISVIDFCFLTTAFVKCFQLVQHFGYAPLATSACASVGILYTSHLIAIVTCWYGITRELSLWIVPKIVLKSTTVIILIMITCVLTYLITYRPRYIAVIIARGLNADYLEHKGAIDFGTIVLVTVSATLAMGQTWLLLLLIGCYRDTRRKELQRLLDEALLREKSKEGRRPRIQKSSGNDRLYTTFI